MNILRRVCSLLLLLLPAAAMAQGLEGSDQLIMVTSKNWDDIQGTAQRYERHAGALEKVGSAFAVVLGKNGMGWGKGLLDTEPLAGPVKQEGDGKAPAGVFKLGTAFGYDASAPTRLPWLTLGPTIECVDDSHSVHYNQLLDNSTPAKDWNSAEHMRRSDELYRQGVFVEHNTPATAGAGSCIFLHIWRGPTAPTRGCTAMDPADIASLLSWFDPRQSPLLVQLPEAQYRQLRERWHLPAL